jgi:dihydroorotase
MQQRFDLVVEGGVVVTPASRAARDIAIRDGAFVALGERGAFTAANASQRLDASGLHVMTGVIDGHVHFRDPGFPGKEDFASGSRAAIHGGVTTVLDMPNTDPPTDSVDRAADKLRRAQAAWCDVGLFGLVVDGSMDELVPMARAGLVVGFKAFMGPTTGGLPAPSEPTLRRAMAIIRSLGMRLAIHAEDEAIVTRETARLRATGRTDPLVHPEGRPIRQRSWPSSASAPSRRRPVARSTSCICRRVTGWRRSNAGAPGAWR